MKIRRKHFFFGRRKKIMGKQFFFWKGERDKNGKGFNHSFYPSQSSESLAIYW